jgi:hypothetical protein
MAMPTGLWSLLAILIAGTASAGGVGETVSRIPPAPGPAGHPRPAEDKVHDLHVSYGNLGVEGGVAILQIRIFKDDLEEALRRQESTDAFRMAASPEVDAVFLRYLSGRFVLEADSRSLEGRVIGSGEDELDREPVWWYQIRYDAPARIRSVRITFSVLFEVFSDQSNVLRVVEFPSEDRRAYYFTRGEETFEMEFSPAGP